MQGKKPQNVLKKVLEQSIDISAQIFCRRKQVWQGTMGSNKIGTYQPPIYHVFIDIDPNWNGSLLKRLEKNIEDFIKIFSIRNKIKVHWNKRPLF